MFQALIIGPMLIFGCLAAEEVHVALPPKSISREVLQPLGMPVVSAWHAMKDSPFINSARQDADGLEALGDWILTPCRYLLGGTDVMQKMDHYSTIPSCNYKDLDGFKTTLSALALPVSLTMGSAIKGMSHLFAKTRHAHHRFKTWKEGFRLTSNNNKYRILGIETLFSDSRATSLNYPRPSKLAKKRQIELQAFKEICHLFKKHEIVFWLDCGSALGAYRHEGMIPWDDDIDISIIADDHENVRKLLETLDPEKYQVQDWSSCLHPQTFIKFYIKETKTLIDIYHYKLDPKAQTATYFYTYQDTPLPRKWKRFEEVLTEPIPYGVMFPLKHVDFDGIDVWVPNDLKTFLHFKYGEDLSPTMIWDEASQSYLKVMNHPYWQLYSD